MHRCLKDDYANAISMVFPPIRGDNPRALARGLSHAQVDNNITTILYHLHQCIPCTLRKLVMVVHFPILSDYSSLTSGKTHDLQCLLFRFVIGI